MRATADFGRYTAIPQGKGSGAWDSIHVIEVIDRARTSHYRMTSTVMLHLGSSSESLGNIDLGGNLVLQKEFDLPVENDNSHIINLGRMIEDTESSHRSLLNEVYFGKARDIVGDLRSISRRFLLSGFP
jgi:capping protein beta